MCCAYQFAQGRFWGTNDKRAYWTQSTQSGCAMAYRSAEVQDALLSMRAAELSVKNLRRELQQQAENAKGTWQAQVSRLGDLELRTLILEAAEKGSQQAGTEAGYYVVNLGTGVFHKTKSRYVRRTKCGRLNKARVPMGLNKCWARVLVASGGSGW